MILWDHCRICGPSLTETSLCGSYLYSILLLKFLMGTPKHFCEKYLQFAQTLKSFLSVLTQEIPQVRMFVIVRSKLLRLVWAAVLGLEGHQCPASHLKRIPDKITYFDLLSSQDILY